MITKTNQTELLYKEYEEKLVELNIEMCDYCDFQHEPNFIDPCSNCIFSCEVKNNFECNGV